MSVGIESIKARFKKKHTLIDELERSACEASNTVVDIVSVNSFLNVVFLKLSNTL